MRVLFYLPSHGSGSSLASMSGTHASAVQIARILNASPGDDARIAASADDLPPDDWLRGVDAFSPSLWAGDAPTRAIAARLDRQRCAIVLWLHCVPLPDANPFPEFRRTVVACPSEFARRCCGLSSSPCAGVVGNGIDADAFALSTPLDERRKAPLSFAFHATFERGCAVAHRVFSGLGGRSLFSIASYHHDPAAAALAAADPRVVDRGSLDKAALREMLLDSDYFVYPLVLPDGRVHHDTFACVVLEAMACGAVVVTWDVACLRELYGADCIVALDVAECGLESAGYDPRAPAGRNPNLLSDAAVAALRAAVERLEADPGEKRRLRENARAKAASAAMSWAAAADALVALVAPA